MLFQCYRKQRISEINLLLVTHFRRTMLFDISVSFHIRDTLVFLTFCFPLMSFARSIVQLLFSTYLHLYLCSSIVTHSIFEVFSIQMLEAFFQVLIPCFSNFSAHENHQEDLLKCKFTAQSDSSGESWATEICNFLTNKLDNTDAESL